MLQWCCCCTVLTSSSLGWKNVAPALGDRFRVIALDARGHGDSEWDA
jgi:pimeloyl-ACP methyl ester carboxylesterase